MSDGRIEERLQDALQEIRRQSVAGGVPAGGDVPSTLEAVSELVADPDPSPIRRWWIPATAAAAVLVLVGVVVLAGRVADRPTNVTASQTEQEREHVRAVLDVIEGCRRFQAARPPEAAPIEVPAELPAWFDRYETAIAEGIATLGRVKPGSSDDRVVLNVAVDSLGRQRRALDAARAAAGAGDDVEAVRLIDQARSYESIAAFELAQWGAAECDARGVTQPTR